jgi:hypothetical protein
LDAFDADPALFAMTPPMRINFGVDDRPIDPDGALLARVSALGG